MLVHRQDSSKRTGDMLLRLLWTSLAAASIGSFCYLQQYSESQSLLLQGSSVLNVQDARQLAAASGHSHSAATSATFPYADALACDTITTRLRDGTYTDPNNGTYNVRQVIDPPVFKMSVHNRDYDYMRYDTIFKRGRYYEHKVTRRFDIILGQHAKSHSAIAPQQSIVLDVGANIGYYTMVAAAYGHKVISFEINPANLIRLCESLSINRFDRRVALYQRGVSSIADKPLRVVIPAHNPGEARMEDPTVAAVDTTATTNARKVYITETTTITLDQFAQDHGWFDRSPATSVSVPLLKLDVEGHEPHIIAGTKQLLCSGIIQNVLLEFNRMHEADSQAAISILLECGFVAVHEENGHTITLKTKAETRPYLEEIQQWGQRTRQNIDLWFQLAAPEVDEQDFATVASV